MRNQTTSEAPPNSPTARGLPESWALDTWSLDQAIVKTSADVSVVTAEFHKVLVERLAEGIGESPTGIWNSPVRIKGRFLLIDEGDRILRLLFPMFAGHTVVEVEWETSVSGGAVSTLRAKEKTTGGALVCTSAYLLNMCARRCGRKVANQTLAELQRTALE